MRTDCTYSVYIRFPICLHFGVEGFHIYSVFHLVWPQRVEEGNASAFAVDFADFQTGVVVKAGG